MYVGLDYNTDKLRTAIMDSQVVSSNTVQVSLRSPVDQENKLALHRKGRYAIVSGVISRVCG